MSETPGELFYNRNVNDRRIFSSDYVRFMRNSDTGEDMSNNDEMLSGDSKECWNCDNPNVGHETTGSGAPLCRSCAKTVPEHILKAN